MNIYKTVILFGCCCCLLFGMAMGEVSAAEQKPVRVTPADVEKAMALKVREEAIAVKEKDVQERERVLADVQKDVDDKLAKLLALQQEVQGHVEEFKTIQTAEFKKMIKIFSALSASKVVTLFDKMDEDEIVRILRAMKFDQVIKIIPKFDPQRAVNISKRLGMMEDQASK